MPENVGIAITLNGDVSPLEHATGSGVKSLQDFEAAINKTTRSMGSIAPASVKAGKALEGVKKSSGQATNSLIDLGRVAQDAPYGFIGIANNLNPLFEGFARLRKESGGLKGALAAMGGALSGPAGIGLAISVVSSLLITFGDKLFKTKSAAESTKEALRKAKESLDDYVEGLDAVDKARVKGAQNAQQELIQLKFLYEATQNTNLSLHERNKAVDALQEKYPTYFANLSNEAILAGSAEKAYQKLTNAIIASAKARAAMKGIEEAQSEIIALERQHAEATQKSFNAQQKLNAATAKADRTEDVANAEELSGRIAFANIAQKDYNKTLEESRRISKRIFELQDQSRDLAKEVTTIVEDNGVDALIGTKTKIPKIKEKKVKVGTLIFDFEKIDLSKDVPVIFPSPDRLKEFLEGMKWQIERGEDKTFGDLDNADELKQRVLNKYRNIFTSVGQNLPKTVKVGNVEVPLNLVTNVGLLDAELQKEAARIQSLITGLNDQVKDFIRNAQVEAISSIGEALGTAIAGGDIQSVFSGLFSALGTAMQSLGKSLIATAVGLKAIKEAFKTLNPIVAAAAGVGLIALGAVIKNQVSKAAPFAAGGLVFGPTVGLVGEGAGTTRNNPEIIAPLNELKNYLGSGNQPIVLETRIRGNDILLSNARTSKRNRRGG